MKWTSKSNKYNFSITQVEDKFILEVSELNDPNVIVELKEYSGYGAINSYIRKRYKDELVEKFRNVSRKPLISKEELKSFYIDEKLSDKQIAEMFQYTENMIRRTREKYGIETRIENEEVIEKIVGILNSKNIEINEVNKNNMILKNGKKVKVFVSHQEFKNYNVQFTLKERIEKRVKLNEYRTPLPNGDLKTLYSSRFDFIIFSWIAEEKSYFWIVPSVVVDSLNYGIAFSPNSKRSKYFIYQDNWEALRD